MTIHIPTQNNPTSQAAMESHLCPDSFFRHSCKNRLRCDLIIQVSLDLTKYRHHFFLVFKWLGTLIISVKPTRLLFKRETGEDMIPIGMKNLKGSLPGFLPYIILRGVSIFFLSLKKLWLQRRSYFVQECSGSNVPNQIVCMQYLAILGVWLNSIDMEVSKELLAGPGQNPVTTGVDDDSWWREETFSLEVCPGLYGIIDLESNLLCQECPCIFYIWKYIFKKAFCLGQHFSDSQVLTWKLFCSWEGV